MIIHPGYIHELVRYPVKSMAGIATDSAFLGWHGLQGDRRFAFRRLNDGSGFPWLTASRLPELLLYEPLGLDENSEVAGGARSLYERNGFKEWGREPRALCWAGQCADESHMVLDFRQSQWTAQPV